MKKLITSVALLGYGAVACALNTIIVNDTPYRATLRYNDNPDQFCQMHGRSDPQCNAQTIDLESKEGVQIVNHERIDLYTLRVNDWHFPGNQITFEIQKTLLPFQQLERQALDSQNSDLLVSQAKKKHDVIINLKLIKLPNGWYTLYLEEPRLFRDKNVFYGYSNPVILSHNVYGNQYQPYNNYGNQYQYNPNQYGNNYGGGYNPYGHGYQQHHQYAHNYGNQYNHYMNQYSGHNLYGNQYQPYNNYGNQYQYNPNQYGNNYGGGYNPYGHGYQKILNQYGNNNLYGNDYF